MSGGVGAGIMDPKYGHSQVSTSGSATDVVHIAVCIGGHVRGTLRTKFGIYELF